MKLYNSLTKQLENFTPIDDHRVRMYSCGPTVYNNLHIGNLSAFIYADVLRRVLSSDTDVTAVMNITDVEDKIIRDSQINYPDLDPMAALKALTEKYESVFMRDIARVGIDVSHLTFIRATETTAEMVAMTQQLIDQGIGYMADDGIYFSLKDYELAGHTYGIFQHIDRSHEVARISSDEYDKDSASDFVLWKKAKPGEPSWPATFTVAGAEVQLDGRPGWHIECSAMSKKLLGLPFDIHTGGIDLKFPHHENEIAQACGATNSKSLANYFVHNNHVLIDGKKMSKSLNNFYTLRDIEEKGFDPQAFRLLVISSHYRSESNFSWDILQAAQNRLDNWRSIADLVWQTATKVDDEEQGGLISSNEFEKNLLQALQDDVNTPAALAFVDKTFDNLSQLDVCSERLESIIGYIKDLLGIDLLSGKSDITDDQKQLMAERQKARNDKDWEKSDAIRDELLTQGIAIRDTDTGQIWNKL